MLTDPKLRNAKPDTKPYKLVDEKGLYIEIKPNGGKTWRYRFRIDGKESTFTIGDYPDVTLAQARDERKKARAMVKEGINPCLQRKIDKVKRTADTQDTLEALALEWSQAKHWSDTTRLKQEAMMRNVIFPRLGALPVKEIMSVHILDMLQYANRKHGPTIAANVRRNLSGIFDHAVSTLRAELNPVTPVRKALKAHQSTHKTPLDPESIGRLLRDAEGYPGHSETLACFKLQWLTLTRPSEVIGARWEEFDLDAAIWKIPGERMKKRKPHTLALPTQAVTLLRAVHALTGRHEHVFPGRDDKGISMSPRSLNYLVTAIGWHGKFTPHAIRTTGSTLLNEMGFDPDLIEAQLAHQDKNAVRRTYNHAQHIEARRAMMQTWADYLDTLRDGKTNVVPIRKAGHA